jgi:hypothetical protein|tara:strand:- start:4480 stop:5589 length:1110 start_codon:yes stop_codon:yes gene_type:complete
MALPMIAYGLGSLALRSAAPSLMRLGSRFLPRLIGGGAKTGIKKTGTAVGPYLGGGATGGGGLPAVVGGGAKTGSSIFRGSSLGPITTGATLMSLPYFIGNEAEISANQNQLPGISDEQRKRDAEDEQVGVPKKTKDDPNDLSKKIDDGELDDYISKNIGLFEKYLGDGKEKTKAAGFQALTEFGLNLATARGGNFLDKVARSAKDPLKTFAEIGKAAKNRADKIKMAAIETGIQQSEAAKDRAEKDKPDDIQTLEYFMSIPGLRDKPIEELIRLSKSKATMSDDDFRKELILSLTPQIGTTITSEQLPGIVDSVVNLANIGTGTGGTGGAGSLSMQEQVDAAKEQGASNDAIRKQLIALGENPADYGF